MRSLSRRLAAAAVALTLPVTADAQITFDPLGGANGSAYVGHVENGFIVAPTTGGWREGHTFGNLAPSVFGVPGAEPGPWTLTVERVGGGTFTFRSIDAASNTAPGTSFLFTGFLGGLGVFSQEVIVPTSDTFVTYLSISSAPIDRLMVAASSAPGVTSFNVDNIGVAAVQTVPEPGTVALVATGLVGVASVARRRRAPA